MFTLEQVKEAHTRVKSGADFPHYVQELKALGVTAYDHEVADGRIIYRGADDFRLEGDPKYPSVPIADTAQPEVLRQVLSVHQAGQTDYPTFCRQAAEAGVERWTLDFSAMTCSYLDGVGNTLIVETIPQG